MNNNTKPREIELLNVIIEGPVNEELERLDRLFEEAADRRWEDAERWAPARATAAKFDAVAGQAGLAEGEVKALVLGHSTDNHVIDFMFGDGTHIAGFNLTDHLFLIDDEIVVTRNGPTYFIQRVLK